jgi:hypothetical protein
MAKVRHGFVLGYKASVFRVALLHRRKKVARFRLVCGNEEVVIYESHQHLHNM